MSVQVTDRFLDEHAAQADALGRIVLIAALRAEGALDRDVREALDAVIRTQKTLQSGVYYQTRPQNRVAAAVADLIQEGWAEYQKAENEKLGFQATHSSELIQLLVFLERVAFDRDNRRPKGRAFIDYLNRFFQKTSELDVPLAEDRLLIVP